MAADEQGHDPDLDPIKLDLDDDDPDSTQSNAPVPVPPPGQQGREGASGPVPVPPPGAQQATEGEGEGPVRIPPAAPKKVEDESPIQLVDQGEVKPAKRKAFGSAASRAGFEVKTDFKRDLNVTGEGATRCKLWHSRIADGPLLHMESMINEWIDENEIEVKFVTQTIGTLEGKRSEENLLVIIWY
ncbi:MAG: hypothetical protein GVY16_01110 [Planctomycetes bacterium]|jgi:hypothetical protein|nr:hypothetical protein [Planctomycetota bacterium]